MKDENFLRKAVFHPKLSLFKDSFLRVRSAILSRESQPERVRPGRARCACAPGVLDSQNHL